MAKVQSKSGLAGRIGAKGKKAVQDHRKDDTRLGNVDLPPGIRNGIAQLVDCRFSQYKSGDNKDEYFFYAAGIVLKPTVHDGIPIKGLRTNITLPCCETKKADGTVVELDHNMDIILNELRKLGADTSEVEVEDLENLAAALKEEAPTFRFSTSQGKPTKQYPNPRVFTNWHGQIDVNDEGESGEQVDNTEEVASDDEVANSTTDETAEAEEQDLETLGQVADDESDEDAQNAAQASLSELCTEAGIDPNDYETWAEVAAILSEANATPAEEEASEEEAEPAVEEVWFYKPTTGKNKGKKVEVEITAVFKGKKQVNCKDLDDNKTVYRNVDWSALASS